MLGGKPLASLSSTLLARKGQAKPAMRSQGFGGFVSNGSLAAAVALDDLGWNDMGQETAAPEPVAKTPVLVPPPAEPTAIMPPPPVVALREALSERMEAKEAAPVEPRPISLATAARIGRESAKLTETGKAAFTLRLDADRHLRLRLASAVSNRSAQLLVVDAVDALLAAMPDVDRLAAQLPEPKRRRPAGERP